jgi:hypothetical protein
LYGLSDIPTGIPSISLSLMPYIPYIAANCAIRFINFEIMGELEGFSYHTHN